MAREYPHIHDFFLQLNDLQPVHYHHYDTSQANTSAAPAYQLTTVASVGSTDADTALPVPHTPHHQIQDHDPPKKKAMHYSENVNYETATCGSHVIPTKAPTMPVAGGATRKRKTSSYGNSSVFDDDGGDDARSTRTLPDKKQNHSEIEKRRRDKMNMYITELSSLVPLCSAMTRKLDKLTVLRMAVQHMRSVSGAMTACQLNARPRPAFLTERQLNALVLHAAHDCFVLVVGCDRGRLHFISASVKNVLHYEQTELLGQSLFDILHPKDVAKVKEQLSSSDLSPRERLIDAKTMLPVKTDMAAGASQFCPGARRSFFCRIKSKVMPESAAPPPPVKEEADPNPKMRKKPHEKKYCVIQCTGYLKSWAPAMLEGGCEIPEDGEGCNMSCLVAVGRALPDLSPPQPPTPAPAIRQLQYISRHTPDGKFLFVDQRVTLALGFLPQELLGTSLYEYVSGPELSAVARTHKAALLTRDALHTPPYSFRKKDGSQAWIQTHFKPFKNPWTKEVECLVANNTVTDGRPHEKNEAAQTPYDGYKQKADLEMQRLIDSQVESHKIGSAIAEEALRRPSTEYSPELPADLLQDAAFNPETFLADENMLDLEAGSYDQVRNNVPLSAVGGVSSPPPSAGEPLPPGTPPPASPPLPPLGLDGNGEAAMAVIMSLLEADAGLGGTVSFSGLPWPLP